MTDDDGFDASDAAARAVGDLADTDADDLEDAPDPDPSDGSDPSDDVDDSDDSGGDSSTGDGAVATFLVPLFVAEEAGPTADTLQEQAGLGERLALVFDGGLDYILHFSDEWRERLEDSLGPAGKFGLAASGLFDDAGDQGDDGADDSGHQQSSDGGDVDVGPDGVGSV